MGMEVLFPQFLGPVRDESAVSGTGDRVFIDAILGGEKPGDKIHVFSFRGDGHAAQVYFLELEHIRIKGTNVLLPGKENKVIL